MKHYLLYSALLIFAIPSAAFSQNIRTLFKNEIVYGKVQMITASQTITSLSTGKTTIPIKDTAYFDEKGNTTERRVRVIELYVYQYATKYDSTGNKLETICNPDHDKQVLQYDESGNMTEIFITSKAGKLYCSERCKYDDKHNLIERTGYLPSGKRHSKTCYRYNDKGFIYEEDDFWTGDKLTQVLFYTYKDYDENGNWTNLQIAENSPGGEPKSAHTITRQITYYQ